MSFICAGMSEVGAIVQAKRERERGSDEAGVRTARRSGQQEAGSRKAGLGSRTLSGDRGQEAAGQESGAGDKV